MTEENMTSKRELIVVANPSLGLRATAEGLASASASDISPLTELLTAEQLTLKSLFGTSEERLQSQAASLATETGTTVPDLSVYYQIDAEDNRLDALAERFQQLDGIEAAYVKPPAEPADYSFNDMTPKTDEPPMATPDFTARQGYLDPAPTGLDAAYAWTVPGGRGTGVSVIDIERGWQFTHEDLRQNQGGVLSGSNASDNNHGTAVIGVIGGDRNGLGITGISPDAQVSGVSTSLGTAEAIRVAADRLNAGDIILIEVHRGGPQYTPGDFSRFGFIAIEWWPDDFDAIRYAVSKGIIVVEAGGNGGQNLDASLYNNRPANHPRLGTFPASWKNPFNPSNQSSGAVIVGAGLPPTGTHGRTRHPGWGDVYADRGRCYFSNYGTRIDTQGWGWEVTTTGYGDLQGGTDRDSHYTDTFSGTSSASPIVVGALACVQGALRTRGKTLLNSFKAIQLLRATGSPQQEGPAFTFRPNMDGTGYPQNHPIRPRSQRIGNRPNLRQMITRALAGDASGGHALWVGASRANFLSKWQELSGQGLRLIDLEVVGTGDQARYSGAFRKGSDAHALWVGASRANFLSKWQELSGQGLRLIDLAIVGTGNQARYSGVFRKGSSAHALWIGASRSSFLLKWQEFSAQGLRLIDLEIVGTGNKARYSGVFIQGTSSLSGLATMLGTVTERVEAEFLDLAEDTTVAPEEEVQGFGAASFEASGTLEALPQAGSSQVSLNGDAFEASEASEEGYGDVFFDATASEASEEGYGDVFLNGTISEPSAEGYGHVFSNAAVFEAEDYGDVFLNGAISEPSAEGYGHVSLV